MAVVRLEHRDRDVLQHVVAFRPVVDQGMHEGGHRGLCPRPVCQCPTDGRIHPLYFA
jgi:hypothetical protein